MAIKRTVEEDGEAVVTEATAAMGSGVVRIDVIAAGSGTITMHLSPAAARDVAEVLRAAATDAEGGD